MNGLKSILALPEQPEIAAPCILVVVGLMMRPCIDYIGLLLPVMFLGFRL